jgi:NAD(P)-dependent dehydrogenase (short-subunit alcohol dehydrogenase family)
MHLSFESKVSLVTGAGSGMGLATAQVIRPLLYAATWLMMRRGKVWWTRPCPPLAS